jgi:hypothetical protein
MYAILRFDGPTRRLTAEDRVIETLGAIMFLLSSLGFGLAYLRSSRSPQNVEILAVQTRKNIFYLLLSLFFLLAFLEEISWGQRIFGIETPAVFIKYNHQEEINIHNLNWFHGRDDSQNRKSFLQLLHNGDRLFSIFWFAYCVCIPLLGKYHQRMKKVFSKIRLPVIPIQYAFLFPFTYVASRAINAMYHLDGVVETKEAVFAVLFACVAFGQVYRLSKNPNVYAPVPN